MNELIMGTVCAMNAALFMIGFVIVLYNIVNERSKKSRYRAYSLGKFFITMGLLCFASVMIVLNHFTATKINYMEFSKVVQFALKHKVDNVWSDRFIPIGSENDPKLLMSLEETNQYLDIMKQERQKLKHNNSKTTISMYRALQFQKTNDFPYSCSAGNSLLTVMENGDLVPCRRMPIVIGNLLQDNMYDLYCNHEVLKQLQKRKIPTECEKCEHAQLCNGGLKCLTFALYHDLNHKDVGCML